MVQKSKREAVIELVNSLFVFTDMQAWERLVKEVFKEKVVFDMSSMGGAPPQEIPAREICEMWKNGFAGIDAVHHQAGNFVVNFKNEEVEADVFCYAIAIHLKRSAKNGTSREFVGSYEIHASFTDLGWRIDRFKYNLKFVRGNEKLT